MNNKKTHLLSEQFHIKLKSKTIAVIGLGGTGSVICQSLAHLGVKNIILVDDDVMDKPNQKKLVGSKYSDIDKTHKCNIMRRLIDNITGNQCSITVRYVKFTKDNAELHNLLRNIDFIFECVDDVPSIRNINAFCVKHKIPFIDCGVGLLEKDETILKLGGQIIFVQPGDPCYECYTIKNGLGYHNRNIPYVQINSIIANLAIMEFVKYISIFGEKFFLVKYDALKQQTTVLEKDDTMPRCKLCMEIYSK